jgi:uncharacterized peroxidase-related enzyme
MNTTQGVDSLFLADVENNPQPSPYADLIGAAKKSGSEYWRIWNLLAFRPKAAQHLARFSHEIMHDDAPISSAMRELIAAYTSSLNRCEFCMKAHAAVAAWLYQDEALVWSVIRDMEGSALQESDKAMLRFVRKVTLDSGAISESDYPFHFPRDHKSGVGYRGHINIFKDNVFILLFFIFPRDLQIHVSLVHRRYPHQPCSIESRCGLHSARHLLW